MKIKEIINYLNNINLELSDIILILEGYFKVPYIKAITEDINVADNKFYYAKDLLEKDYPPAYLAGYVTVRNLKIFVSEDVLIPRSETIDFIYEYIKSNFDFNNKSVLDLCTGSGVISFALKTIYKSSSITGSDISDAALNLAKKSAEYNKLDIQFIKSNFLNDIYKKYDYIISNPPYIEENNKDTYAPFEPRLALYSGEDGLDSYRNIFSNLDSRLNEKGIAFFEIETSNYSSVKELASKMLKGYLIETYKDMENKERYLILKK